MNKGRKMKIITMLFLFIITLIGFSSSEITLKTKSYVNNVWESDSVFIGAGFIVKDSTTDIIVKWKYAKPTRRLGALYFMIPRHKDSALFIFHNFIDSFPEEVKEINLGKYAKGTELYFKYMIIDTSSDLADYYEKKLYSGQNRTGIDNYISERETSVFGKRWAAVGRIDSSRIEVGFSDWLDMGFDDFLFEISGVGIVK
jgi:hypothetical protein